VIELGSASARIFAAQILAAEDTQTFSVPILVVAAGVALAWWAVLAVVVAARRPPRIKADGGGALELPPEPPAVAAILAGDFEVASETAPAIVLDLAARDFVELDEVQPGKTICRIRRAGSADPGPLNDYEQRVLVELTGKAVDGVVPVEALTTGPAEQSRRWHRALTREVVGDAQARGLTKARWPLRLTTVLGALLAIVVVLLYASAEVGGDADDEGTLLGAIAAAVALTGLLVGVIVVGRLGRSLAQLPTDAGLDAAPRVVGLATTLRDNDALGELPPAGVKLWDRVFAYAAAFGAAPLAVELLPMGAEDDHQAWSHFGGRWRRVRVRYPRGLPPAWGKHPLFALALALFWGAVALVIGYGLLQLIDADRPTEISADAWDWVELAASLALVPVILMLLWCGWVMVRALPDLWQHRTVTGDIVRSRRYRQIFTSNDNPSYWQYLAIDDGSRDRIPAWKVSVALWSAHSQGEAVEAEITPRLGYVRSMRSTG
jgi:Predicted membrane protein (DUF2207)